MEKENTHFSPEIGNVYRYFRKTPDTINCPHFWMLTWGFGCPFNCSYCYLQGTSYGDKHPRHRLLVDILRATDMMFEHHKGHPHLFNSGELSESMMFPKIMEGILDRFEEQDKHKVLILTKAGIPKNKHWFKFLLDKKYEQVIISFSVNSMEASYKWEKDSASPFERLQAGKLLSEMGYEIRIRYDPIFPIENWKVEYTNIVDITYSKLGLNPERITLGTPRGLRNTLRFAKDRSWTKWFVKDETGWGKKLPDETRLEIYRFMRDKIREYDSKVPIGICKETWKLWEQLGWNGKKMKCNCIW